MQMDREKRMRRGKMLMMMTMQHELCNGPGMQHDRKTIYAGKISAEAGGGKHHDDDVDANTQDE